MNLQILEKFRIKSGPLKTAQVDLYGAFFMPFKSHKTPMKIMASPMDGDPALDWQHVSCSFPDRCPTWDEMCIIKDIFWKPEDCCIQIHPPASEYVNNHKYCLHIWKYMAGEIPRPRQETVGIKGIGVIE